LASDMISLVNEVFDISVTLQQVTDEQREAGLAADGVPTPLAKHLTSVYAATRKGDFDSVTDIIGRLAGIPPARQRSKRHL
jgi:hypothetical protein